MRCDFAVDDFKQPPHPKGLSLLGNTVKLEPIDVEAHASDLYEAFSLDVEGEIWKYLPYGSFEKFEDFYHWLTNEIAKDEATFFSIWEVQFFCILPMPAELKLQVRSGQRQRQMELEIPSQV